jgi:hypothetical protein
LLKLVRLVVHDCGGLDANNSSVFSLFLLNLTCLDEDEVVLEKNELNNFSMFF